MPSIALYLKTHQPFRLKKHRIFDIGHIEQYFDEFSGNRTDNAFIARKVAEKSYIPTNKILMELINEIPDFKLSISVSGVLLEQLEKYAPDALQSFKDLIATGRVEVIGETYYHSLSFFYSQSEFEAQIAKQNAILKRLFGIEPPKVLSNTELAYRNDLGKWCDEHGYTAVITEGWEKYMGWRTSNFVYKPPQTQNVRLLLKNYRLSDDIAFRFSNKSWTEWPLTAEKFTSWVNAYNGNGDVINLFMDYETFGEHQWKETGIFDFLKAMPHQVLAHPDNKFITLSEEATELPLRDEVDIPEIVTWADTERDLTAWIGNEMQRETLDLLYKMEPEVLATQNEEIIDIWRKLQTSDHVYYMCTKWSSDGDVHAYFSPYESPYDAYIAFTNAITDLQLKIKSNTQHNG